ncbi:putative aliphatic sulfonates transport permease protein SsuC [Eubacterium plexicaudatum ASF492]|uniref:ABC transmembrane type-1 domain-containing protein n=1 Tax=Eubacterium plexicaudatum ASF492 TaxID=1235802 RepID=N2A6Q1_9FIRM|nr:putative aliphatic sulfonates transport permease protein SsuC [Eubacterium plexicaudatum ASF492]
MKKALTAQELYLDSVRRTNRNVRFWRIGLCVIFIAAWELCARYERINSFIFSSPSKLVSCFGKLLMEEGLLGHIGITLFETLVSFVLVIVVSLIFAILLWKSRTISQIVEPYMVMLNSLPKSALAPLLIVWLGANYKTIILTGMSVAVFGSIMNVYTGFTEVDAEKIKLIYTLTGTEKDALYKVILPANIPNLFSIMKVNIGLCLVGVIIGEFIAARRGLGYLIIYGSQVFKMDWVILSILILCVIAMVLYLLLDLSEKFYRKRTL